MILEKQHIDFEQIYLSYFSKMKRFAREYVLSDEDAENIVQDVFLDFWEKKELLPLPINILAYLFTSIKNRCIDFLRHKIVQKEVENKMQEEYRLTLQMKYYSLGELDEGIFEKDDVEQLLSKVIDSLPERCREIFLKSKIEGKKQKEIAEEMNISINTVETQMGIAYKKLRKALQLAVNAEVQKGVRLKDMPDEWFPNDEVTDYRNIMQVAVKLLYISRYVDRKEFETAHVLFSEIERHKEEIVGLYVKEIECELLFLELIGERRKEEIERLYTDKIKRYIQRYKIMMSSKQRLLCALALYWENQPERAKEIYEKVARKRDKYLLQGEVNSDLDIMETMLREAQVQV